KASERLTTIDWPQLRMTFDETRAIAAARTGADEKTIRQIFQISDGWAAGIALTMQRVGSGGDWSKSGDREARQELFDYFAALVLSTAPLETQQFLERTALLPDMTAQLAENMSEGSGAERLLEDLYRRGVFIDRRNTQPPTYHYHDLFRAFLLARLEQSVPA